LGGGGGRRLVSFRFSFNFSGDLGPRLGGDGVRRRRLISLDGGMVRSIEIESSILIRIDRIDTRAIFIFGFGRL
jgi:hypothetical protein